MNNHTVIKVVTHASTFFAPILVPLLVWVLIPDEAMKRMAMQAFLFHIIMSILIGISWIFTFIIIGFPFLVVFAIMAIYYPIKGILYALNDRPFSYPIVGRMF